MFRPSLLLLGLMLGLGLGLLYGWVISPVQYTDTEPHSLRADYRAGYLRLVAAAYGQDHDLDRVRLRLAKLKDPDPAQTITALAQRLAADGEDATDLALLATDLNGGPRPPTPEAGSAPSETLVATSEPTPPTETYTPLPTASPVATLSIFSTLTPTATPEYDYALISREAYCNDQERRPLIIVDVIDSGGDPLSGVRVTVQWPEGQDGFVTGLKPEISPSYGDYLMEVGTIYSLQIGARTPPITGLTAPTCESSAETASYPGAIRLVFQRK